MCLMARPSTVDTNPVTHTHKTYYQMIWYTIFAHCMSSTNTTLFQAEKHPFCLYWLLHKTFLAVYAESLCIYLEKLSVWYMLISARRTLYIYLKCTKYPVAKKRHNSIYFIINQLFSSDFLVTIIYDISLHMLGSCRPIYFILILVTLQSIQVPLFNIQIIKEI